MRRVKSLSCSLRAEQRLLGELVYILYIILEHKVAAVTAECMEKCIEFVIYEDDVWRGKT